MKSKLILKKHTKIILLLILPFAAAGMLLLAKNLYARFVVPWMPPCILRTLTGWKCPSCGMTHAVYALCRLDFAEVLRQNAMLLLGTILALLRYTEMWCSALRKPKKLIPRNKWFWIAVLLLWFGYTILRNVLHI